ncbi:MAG: hypothetical protein WB383_08360 [Acidimicrobiales bacterium]
MSSETRHLAAVVANAVRWAAETDRTKATEPARDAVMAQFRTAVAELADAKGLKLGEDELEARAARLRSAYFARMRLDAIERRRQAEAPRPEVNPKIAALAADVI